jgi:hypothetical protein
MTLLEFFNWCNDNKVDDKAEIHIDTIEHYLPYIDKLKLDDEGNVVIVSES